jgi:hypothetical protein
MEQKDLVEKEKRRNWHIVLNAATSIGLCPSPKNQSKFWGQNQAKAILVKRPLPNY